jgi:hypothetical protein
MLSLRGATRIVRQLHLFHRGESFPSAVETAQGRRPWQLKSVRSGQDRLHRTEIIGRGTGAIIAREWRSPRNLAAVVRDGTRRFLSPGKLSLAGRAFLTKEGEHPFPQEVRGLPKSAWIDANRPDAGVANDLRAVGNVRLELERRAFNVILNGSFRKIQARYDLATRLLGLSQVDMEVSSPAAEAIEAQNLVAVHIERRTRARAEGFANPVDVQSNVVLDRIRTRIADVGARRAWRHRWRRPILA